MTTIPRFGQTAMVMAIFAVVAVASAASAADDVQRDFERGYFLQTHQRDCAAAAAAFEKVVAATECPAALKAEATYRLAQCREDVAAADLARLMPPEALAYAEFTEPGKHARQLLTSVGLLRDPAVADAAATEGLPTGTPLAPWLFFPDDFSISPALVAEIERFRGVAVAITSIDPEMRRPPEGVLVLHPGELRGELETVVQLLPPAEPIEGFKTYQVEGQVWITMTTRLVIVSNSRQNVADAVARLKNSGAGSLAADENFKRCAEDRDGALLFVYASGPALLEAFGPQFDSQEAVIARIVLDLDNLQSITAALGTTEQGLELKACVNMAPGHRNLALGLIQTAPASRRSLAFVPGEAAGVALLGLNPATEPAAVKDDEARRPLTAMDIGREVFSNIEELAGFVMAPADGDASELPIPEFGVVIAVSDAAKSEALWNQLLVLPMLFGLPGVSPPQDVTIAGIQGKLYPCPEGPQLVVLRADARTLIVGTPAAVAAAVKAGAEGNGLQEDPAFKPLLARLDPNTSKALLIDAGRMAQMSAEMAQRGMGHSADSLRRHIDNYRQRLETADDPQQKQQLQMQITQLEQIAVQIQRNAEMQEQMISMVAELIGDLKITAVSEEGPTKFAVRAEATGLPNVPRIVKMVAPMIMQELAREFGPPPMRDASGPPAVRDTSDRPSAPRPPRKAAPATLTPR